jgi:hypothetical protein
MSSGIGTPPANGTAHARTVSRLAATDRCLVYTITHRPSDEIVAFSGTLASIKSVVVSSEWVMLDGAMLSVTCPTPRLVATALERASDITTAARGHRIFSRASFKHSTVDHTAQLVNGRFAATCFGYQPRTVPVIVRYRITAIALRATILTTRVARIV